MMGIGLEPFSGTIPAGTFPDRSLGGAVPSTYEAWRLMRLAHPQTRQGCLPSPLVQTGQRLTNCMTTHAELRAHLHFSALAWTGEFRQRQIRKQTVIKAHI